MTRLEAFLQTIDPDRTLDEVQRRADEALNSFPARAATVNDWRVFEAVLTAFYCHLENHVLRLRTPRGPNRFMDSGRSFHILIHEYGPDGDKVAYQLAQTGMEGGLYGILKTIANSVVKKYGDNEILARIADFIDRLTPDEMMDCANEYFAKFKHLLPPEFADDQGLRVKIAFHKVLAEHPRMLQRFRRSAR